MEKEKTVHSRTGPVTIDSKSPQYWERTSQVGVSALRMAMSDSLPRGDFLLRGV